VNLAGPQKFPIFRLANVKHTLQSGSNFPVFPAQQNRKPCEKVLSNNACMAGAWALPAWPFKCYLACFLAGQGLWFAF
jgi:hypothetical protein